MQDLKFANELRNIPREFSIGIKPSRKGIEDIKRKAKELMRKNKNLTVEEAVGKVTINKIKEIQQKIFNELKRKNKKNLIK